MGEAPRQPPSPPVSATSERLDSWKEIAGYLKREVRTVQLWEKHEGLPVHRHMHDGRSTVYAYRAELDTWWNNRRPRLEAEEAKEKRRRWAIPLTLAVLVLAVGLGLWRARDFATSILHPGSRVSFDRKVYLSLESGAYPVVGDFNGDGILDIAASFNTGAFPTNPSKLAVFLGIGEGSFSRPTIYEPSDGCWTMGGFETTDLNNDGILDLVRLADGSNVRCFGNKFTVHLGDGTGRFDGPGKVFTTGGTPTSVAFGDFNEDGNRDLAIYSRDETKVFIHFGDGSGSFIAGPQISLAKGRSSSGELMSSDLNGDGHMDLVVTLYQLNEVKVLLGTGTGSLVVSPSSFAIPTPLGITEKGFSEDLKNAFAIVSNLDGRLHVLQATEEGLSLRPVSYAVAPPATNVHAGLTRLVTGDFNSDGYFDLAIVYGSAKTFSILPGDGPNQFGAPLHLPIGSSAGWRVRAGDFNKDGLQDLVMTSSHPPGLVVLLNTTRRPKR